MRIVTTANETYDLNEISDEYDVKVVFLSQTFKDRVRVWVLQNAFTLIFLSAMFLVTWTLLLVLLLNKS